MHLVVCTFMIHENIAKKSLILLISWESNQPIVVLCNMNDC